MILGPLAVELLRRLARGDSARGDTIIGRKARGAGQLINAGLASLTESGHLRITDVGRNHWALKRVAS